MKTLETVSSAANAFSRRNSSKFPLWAILVIAALLASRAAYAIPVGTTYTVTDLSDSATDTGSLRYAVNSATSGGDTINFASNVIGTITLTNGTLTIGQSVTISGPGAGLLAISGNNAATVFTINSGTVTISGLTIANGNSGANSGGGIASAGALTLRNCDLVNNTSPVNNGGAIYSIGWLLVSECNFSGNSTNAGGGAITNASGTLSVENSSFWGNTSAAGGAIFNNGGTATIANITVFGNNSTTGPGGGIFNNGTMTVSNSTIDGNAGGGIFNNGGGPTLTLGNSIVAENTPSGNDCVQCGTQPGTTNIIGGTPNLGPLQLNGGLTPTMMPLPGSPAIGVGANKGQITDQRGFARPGPICDLGAVQTYYLTVTTVDDSTGSGSCTDGGTCSLRDAFNLAVSRGSADIVFQSGVTGTITLGSPLPSVTRTLSISGPGAERLSISGANQYGVFSVISGADLAITGLTMTGGYNALYGSGAIIDQGTLTVENSAFSGTSAEAGGGSGGGIMNDGGVAVVLASTFSGNSSQEGGAIFNDGSTVIGDSTFSGNSALEGGAIYTEAPMMLSSNTIDGNSATNATYGGGIYDASLGSTLVVKNSILAGNTSGSPAASDDCAQCGTQDPGNMIGGAPGLSSLAYNGLNATVQTMLPMPGSPAIQAGDPTQLFPGLTTDARGFPRLTGGKLDVGAAQTHYTSLRFVQQPTDTAFNATINPAVTIQLLETNTNLPGPNNTDAVNVSGVPVTLTFSGIGTLAGTLTQSITGGLASFDDLGVNTVGTGDTLSTSLTITPNGVTPAQTLAATSNPFDIILVPSTVNFNPPLPAGVTYGVSPLTLKATAYSSGTPTGQTVTFQVDSGPATVSGNVLTISGGGSVVVEVDAAANGTYAAADAIATIAVAQAASSLALTSSATQAGPGATITLTATATSNSPGAVDIPTGTVTFLTASGPLGTATLNAQGVATLAVTTLPAGSNAIAASYSGDGNYSGSGAQLSAPIIVGTPTFSIASSVSSVAIQRGQVGTLTLTLTPSFGYTGPVTFACSGLPVQSSCNFGANSVTFDGSGVPVQVSLAVEIGRIGLASRTSVTRLLPSHPLRGLPILPAVIFWMPGTEFSLEDRKRKKNSRGKTTSRGLLLGIALLALSAGMAGLVGCSGMKPDQNGPAPGPQTITIIATGSGNASESVSVLVHVL